MNTRKNIFGGLAAVVLPVALFAFGAYMGAFQFLSSPEPVKGALSESGLYDAVATEALTTAQNKLSETSGLSLPADNPEVHNLFKQAVPAADVQKQAEGAVDNIFAWLHGERDKLDFAISLDQAKTQLADNLATYTEQHLANLPTCTGGEVPDIQDPLNATCWSAGADTSIASAKVRDGIMNNQALLQNSSLTESDVQNNNGETLEQQLSSVPAAYEQIKWGTYITAALGVLCTVLVLLFSGGLANGLKRFGIIALIVGGVGAVIAWLAGVIIQRIAQGVANDSTSSALQGSAVKAVELLTQDVRNWWLLYGLGLIVLGAGALVSRLVIAKRGEPTESSVGMPVATPTGTLTSDRPVEEQSKVDDLKNRQI